MDGTFRWRHNGRDGVSNHQPHDCLLNRLFGRRSKKTSKLRVTGLCAGNSPVTGEFPAQMASDAENVSIWWRHHDSLPLSSAMSATPRSVLYSTSSPSETPSDTSTSGVPSRSSVLVVLEAVGVEDTGGWSVYLITNKIILLIKSTTFSYSHIILSQTKKLISHGSYVSIVCLRKHLVQRMLPHWTLILKTEAEYTKKYYFSHIMFLKVRIGCHKNNSKFIVSWYFSFTWNNITCSFHN